MKLKVLIILVLLSAVVSAQPPVTNGLTLHLDAATGLTGNNPSIWPDLSGLGNNVTTNLALGSDPTMATVRGRNVVRFIGGSVMSTANPNIVTGTTGTIFSVVSGFVTGTKVSVAADNNLGQELLLLDNIAYHNTTANNFVGLGHQCIANIPSDSIVVESATFRPGNTLFDITHYANGVVANQSITNNYGSPINYNNVGRYAHIGGRIWQNNPNSSQDLFRGGEMDMYEILVYNRELTQSEVDMVHQYLQCKYAIKYATCNVIVSCTPNITRDIVWQDSCSNNNINFSLSNTALIDSIKWTFGDPQSGNNTSTLFNPTHIYATSGSYTVQAVVWSAGSAVTLTEVITVYPGSYVVNLGADTTYCNAFSRVLNATQNSQATYLWNNGSSLPTLSVNSPGQYWVTVYGPCDTIRDTITIEQFLPIELDMSDGVICFGGSIVLDASTNNATNYVWQNGSTGAQLTVGTAGQYWVTVSNGCYSITDTVSVSEVGALQWNYISDTANCEGDTIQLNVGVLDSLGYAWQWNDSLQDTLRVFESGGLYWLDITNGCERIYDTIEVVYYSLPELDLGPDTTFCGVDIAVGLELDAGQQDSYLWDDGTTSRFRDVAQVGTYMVTVSNSEGCTATDTIVIGKEGIYVPNAFSPNDDGINDVYRVYGLCYDEFEMRIFNRLGHQVFQTNDKNVGWDGRFKGVLLHPGLFLYQIRFIDIFGDENYKTGTVMLLR